MSAKRRLRPFEPIPRDRREQDRAKTAPWFLKAFGSRPEGKRRPIEETVREEVTRDA